MSAATVADPPRILRAASLLLLALLGGCGGDPQEPVPQAPDTPRRELPAAVEIPSPDDPVVAMELVEDYSEAVANRMLGFSDKLRRRDFRAAGEWVSADFAGHGFSGLGGEERTALHRGGERTVFDASTAPVHAGRGFVDSIAAWIAPWSRVESVLWKVKGAEFQAGTPLWGVVRFRVSILGSGEDGGPRSLVAWGRARMLREKGQWMLAAFALESLAEERRAAPLFTDVATAVGLAHSGIRFGQRGNDSFAWNGAACGDVDADGAFDLFVPSRPANFLYVSRPLPAPGKERATARFVDEAGARGVREPAGGTGAVFFDHDSDGDQDLAVGDVGWEGPDGAVGGNPLRLYENDGDGRFRDVGPERGFATRCNAYTLIVLDAELDGHLDVFVCNYGRVEAEPNDSWVDARNGMPNALFRNVDGRSFRDVAADVGLADRRWSYAGAAADFDADGDMDLYVANDYAVNSLWENVGDGTFRDAADDAGVRDLGNGMGAAWGDLDGDGRLDLYVANMSSTAGNRILQRLERQDDAWKNLSKMAAGNTIFLGRDGAFEAADPSAGGIGASWAWSPVLADLDLDGRLDLYCANGFVTGDTLADT